ncbi:MAG: shikimate kinase [Helcococcus sp.]|nr:shikimate kinase [Helcococcus sp.]
MKKKNNKFNKIEYYFEDMKDIDSQLNDLFLERVSLSEEIFEYIFKNNLENDEITKNIQFVNFNGISEISELNELYKILIKANKKQFNRVRSEFNLKYALVNYNEKKLTEYILNRFVSKEFGLFTLNENEIENLIKRNNFKGYFINTDNSKQLIDLLVDCTFQVRDIECLNLIQKFNGKNFGFNTEYYGYMQFFKKYGLQIEGKDIIILSGNDSTKSLQYCLKKLKANSIEIYNKDEICRKEYHNQVLINMLDSEIEDYENLIYLSNFPYLEYIIDFSNDVFFSKLYIDAKNNNIDIYHGFCKEVYETKKSLEILTSRKYNDYIFENIFDDYIKENLNIVLVGMPGAGKTTIGRKLGKIMGRKHYDLDREFQKEYGISPAEFLRCEDESKFREMEKKIVRRLGNLQNVIISTSGGVVSKMENYYHLKKNSIIFMIERNINYLSTRNRPLSEGGIETLIKMKEDRDKGYKYFTDYTVENRGNFDKAAYLVEEKFKSLEIF